MKATLPGRHTVQNISKPCTSLCADHGSHDRLPHVMGTSASLMEPQTFLKPQEMGSGVAAFFPATAVVWGELSCHSAPAFKTSWPEMKLQIRSMQNGIGNLAPTCGSMLL